tara:strand:- start:45 stop:599 length:555 start_codon:yes stop_codon:yes gene_type:complete
MLLPDVKEIVKMYTKLGISQKKLAEDIGVEVTWLNKVVKGKIPEPGYNHIRRIFDYLEEKENEKETKVQDICVRHVTMVKLGTPILQISKMLKKKGFNQAPVTKRDKVIGTITSEKLMEFNGLDVKNMSLKEEHLLPEPFEAAYNQPAKSLIPMFKYSSCILVKKKGEIIGIITAEDMFRLLLA